MFASESDTISPPARQQGGPFLLRVTRPMTFTSQIFLSTIPTIIQRTVLFVFTIRFACGLSSEEIMTRSCMPARAHRSRPAVLICCPSLLNLFNEQTQRGKIGQHTTNNKRKNEHNKKRTTTLHKLNPTLTQPIYHDHNVQKRTLRGHLTLSYC